MEKHGEEEKDEDEDERLLQEFEDEIADLSVPSDKIDEIKEEIQKEFNNIINEVADRRKYDAVLSDWYRNYYSINPLTHLSFRCDPGPGGTGDRRAKRGVWSHSGNADTGDDTGQAAGPFGGQRSP